VRGFRDERGVQVQGLGETQLRYPLKGLGSFVECLLVSEFRKQGFLGPSSIEPLSLEDLRRLSDLHTRAREQLGEALYRNFPWSHFFKGLGLSQQVTWESGPALLDPSRVFMSTEDSLRLARVLASSPCHKLRPSGVEHISNQGWQLYANEDGSFLAWSSQKVVAASSLGQHQHFTAARRLEQIVDEEKSQP